MLPKWQETADFLLGQRDRFTQQKVREEFGEMCQTNNLPSLSVMFDPVKHGYLTKVADRRYSVIWYLEDETPVVRAVVPTTRFDESMDDLKERVESSVQRESDGAVKLP